MNGEPEISLCCASMKRAVKNATIVAVGKGRIRLSILGPWDGLELIACCPWCGHPVQSREYHEAKR